MTNNILRNDILDGLIDGYALLLGALSTEMFVRVIPLHCYLISETLTSSLTMTMMTVGLESAMCPRNSASF